jgi:hypothetical protein
VIVTMIVKTPCSNGGDPQTTWLSWSLMTAVLRTSSTPTRTAEKQASRARDAAAITSGRKTVQDLRRENEAFTYARSAVSIGFARSFSR